MCHKYIFQLLTTSCEPRLVPTTESEAILLWLCQDNVTEPNATQLLTLCQHLLDQNVASGCKPPNGEIIQPSTASFLEGST